MNREEYLNQLNKHLRKLPKSDYENAMEYFTEYFEEVGEQQAMEELGTPEEAAADIVNSLLNQNPKKGHKIEKQGKVLLAIFLLLLLLGTVVIAFWGSIGNRTDSGNIKVDTGNIKTGDVKTGNIQKDSTDNAQKESGNKDLNGIRTWQEDDIRLDSVSSIKADLTSIDLRVAVSDDNDFHMSYKLQCMNSKNPLSYQLEKGLLTLTETDLKVPSWSGLILHTESVAYKYDGYITLYVPSDAVLKNCSLNMADSDLKIDGLSCNLMEIKTADGDIDIMESSWAKTVLDVEDGDIIFSDTTISGDLQLDTADGDISVSGLNVKGAAQFDTADGDISASSLNVNGTVRVDTADGDVSFAGLKASGGMKINVEDGDVSISNLTSAGAVEIIASGGDIKISDFTESTGLFIQTEYGDVSGSAINVTGEMKINTEDGDVTLSNLGVAGKIDIASDCGDISAQLQKKSLSALKITMDTEDGELSVSRSLGGKKVRGHYERNGSADRYLKGYTEEGDISIS